MFNNSNDFSLHIETTALSNKSTYVDTILSFCEEKEIDVDDITHLINKSLKEKIALEVRFSNSAELEDDSDRVQLL